MRKQSFFYSDRQNALIEKAAMTENFTKRAASLAKQFNRPKSSLIQKMYNIRKNKGLVPVEKKAAVLTTKEKFVKVTEGTVINFNNVKKAEMHSDHVRIYF